VEVLNARRQFVDLEHLIGWLTTLAVFGPNATRMAQQKTCGLPGPVPMKRCQRQRQTRREPGTQSHGTHAVSRATE
jgi:hypothetical protein